MVRLHVYEQKRAKDTAGRPGWRWRLRASNGHIVADGSEGYASRKNAERAARRVVALFRGRLVLLTGEKLPGGYPVTETLEVGQDVRRSAWKG